MTIAIRWKKTKRNTTNSKKYELAPEREHMPKKRQLTECELIQIVGGDDDQGNPAPPPYMSQQHNEHHLQWKKARQHRIDSQNREPKLKREPKSSKRHLTEREMTQVVGGDGPIDPTDPDHIGQQHNEHHLRWKKAGQGRTDSKKYELKPRKRH